MPKNNKLKKVGNIYFSNNVVLYKKQKITADAFTYMWKNSFPYDNPTKSEIKRLYDSSNGLVPKWIAKYFGSLGLKKIKFLDVGCGYGYGFKAFFSKYISGLGGAKNSLP